MKSPVEKLAFIITGNGLQGHERDEVDSLDGETLHKMGHGNG